MNLIKKNISKNKNMSSDDTGGLNIVATIFILFSLFLFMSFATQEKTLDNWSHVGASFGILSALFTGLAFAVLIITMRQQRKQLSMQSEELKLQRKELKATRKVLKKQNKEFRLQSETMKRQQFENTFFKLTELYTFKKEELTLKCESESFKGEFAFKKYYFILQEHLNSKEHNNLSMGELYLDKNNEDYIFNELAPEFLVTFNVQRVLDLLVGIIDFYNKNYYETKIYLNIIDSIITDYELALLFYLCATDSLRKKSIITIYKSKILLKIDINLLTYDFDMYFSHLLSKTNYFDIINE